MMCFDFEPASCYLSVVTLTPPLPSNQQRSITSFWMFMQSNLQVKHIQGCHWQWPVCIIFHKPRALIKKKSRRIGARNAFSESPTHVNNRNSTHVLTVFCLVLYVISLNCSAPIKAKISFFAVFSLLPKYDMETGWPITLKWRRLTACFLQCLHSNVGDISLWVWHLTKVISN